MNLADPTDPHESGGRILVWATSSILLLSVFEICLAYGWYALFAVVIPLSLISLLKLLVALTERQADVSAQRSENYAPVQPPSPLTQREDKAA
jgi:hypothetical protein